MIDSEKTWQTTYEDVNKNIFVRSLSHLDDIENVILSQISDPLFARFQPSMGKRTHFTNLPRSKVVQYFLVINN